MIIHRPVTLEKLIQQGYNAPTGINTVPGQSDDKKGLGRSLGDQRPMMRNQSCALSPWLPDISPHCKQIFMKSVNNLDKKLPRTVPQPSALVVSSVHVPGNPVGPSPVNTSKVVISTAGGFH